MSFLDQFEGRGNWAFHPWFGLWMWLLIAAMIGLLRGFLGLSPITGTVVAFLGAAMACLGAVTIARPVVRAGGYRSWLEKQSIIGGASYVPTPAEQLEMSERLRDSLAVNVVGPALAIVGTMMNGSSGFLPL